MSIAAVLESRSSDHEMPLERVEAELCTLAGQMAAATGRFLRLLADFDARDGWAGWGVRSCAHWLSWRCGLDLRTAREYVRVARALQGLPKVSAALAEGRVSYSKVRAVSRVATPENEDDLVHVALHNPAAHLDRLVRGLLKARREDDEPDPRSRTRNQVQWRWDDDGSLVVWGKLDAEDGARVLAGLARMDEERRRAEPSHQVHASRDDPAVASGSAEPQNEQNGSAEPSWSVSGRAPSDLGPALVAAAELLCSDVEAPVFAPAADVVVHTDVEFLHAHHVIAWAAGGPTDLDNLALLCGEHHGALHEGAFSVIALGQQRFRFHGPRGAVRPPAPKLAGDLTRLTRAYPDITPGTIEPDWDGSPLDLAYAVDVFLTGWAQGAARPVAVASSAPRGVG